jgi:tetratricopeptide (TPR) repeat protein
MAEPISIQSAPSKYRPYLKAADDKGDKNGHINTNEEAQAAVAVCEERAMNCEGLKKFIKSYQFQLTVKTEKNQTRYNELKAMLEKIHAKKDENAKADAIVYVSYQIVEAGLTKDKARNLFNEVLKIARSIKGPFTFGSFPPAYMGTTRPNPLPPHFPLPNIACTMAKSGLNKNEVMIIVNETLSILRKIKDPEYKSRALKDFAMLMSNDGFDKSQVHNVLKEALGAARLVKDLESKAKALNEIATQMISSGIDKRIALNIFKEALAETRNINEPDDKASALYDIATSLAEAGFYKEALAIARGIKDSIYKLDCFRSIAEFMAEANRDKSEIIKLFNEALVVARGINDKNVKEYDVPLAVKAHQLTLIAGSTIRAGLEKSNYIDVFKEALRVVRAANDPLTSNSIPVRVIIYHFMKEAKLQESEIKALFQDAQVKLPK